MWLLVAATPSTVPKHSQQPPLVDGLSTRLNWTKSPTVGTLLRPRSRERRENQAVQPGMADPGTLKAQGSRGFWVITCYTNVFTILHGLSVGLGMVGAPYQEQPAAYVFRRKKRLAFELWYEESRRSADAAAEAMFQNRP